MHCLPIPTILYSKMKYPSTGRDLTLEKWNFLFFHNTRASMEMQHLEITWNYLNICTTSFRDIFHESSLWWNTNLHHNGIRASQIRYSEIFTLWIKTNYYKQERSLLVKFGQVPPRCCYYHSSVKKLWGTISFYSFSFPFILP